MEELMEKHVKADLLYKIFQRLILIRNLDCPSPTLALLISSQFFVKKSFYWVKKGKFNQFQFSFLFFLTLKISISYYWWPALYVIFDSGKLYKEGLWTSPRIPRPNPLPPKMNEKSANKIIKYCVTSFLDALLVEFYKFIQCR